MPASDTGVAVFLSYSVLSSAASSWLGAGPLWEDAGVEGALGVAPLTPTGCGEYEAPSRSDADASNSSMDDSALELCSVSNAAASAMSPPATPPARSARCGLVNWPGLIALSDSLCDLPCHCWKKGSRGLWAPPIWDTVGMDTGGDSDVLDGAPGPTRDAALAAALRNMLLS